MNLCQMDKLTVKYKTKLTKYKLNVKILDLHYKTKKATSLFHNTIEINLINFFL